MKALQGSANLHTWKMEFYFLNNIKLRVPIMKPKGLRSLPLQIANASLLRALGARLHKKIRDGIRLQVSML